MTYAYCFQLDALELDVLEVLRLIWSGMNSIAPINRIPPEVLLLIPDHYDERDRDKCILTSTQVCRGWRDMYISLWSQLDLTNVDRIRTYTRRIPPAPFEIRIRKKDDEIEANTFLLMIPHIHLLKSLTIERDTTLPSVLGKFKHRTPPSREARCQPIRK